MKLLDQVVPPAGGEYARALSPGPCPVLQPTRLARGPLPPTLPAGLKGLTGQKARGLGPSQTRIQAVRLEIRSNSAFHR